MKANQTLLETIFPQNSKHVYEPKEQLLVLP